MKCRYVRQDIKRDNRNVNNAIKENFFYEDSNRHDINIRNVTTKNSRFYKCKTLKRRKPVIKERRYGEDAAF